MPHHYPTPAAAADRLLPFRWQVQTIEDARRLVLLYLEVEDEAIAQAFFKRCSAKYKKEIE